jgi:hypothetical protein
MFDSKRELLLVEIERRCADPACDAAARVGLTKAEARAYSGFECERCARWNEDALSERDVPEWWEELRVTGLEGVRALESARPGDAADSSAASVRRLSDEWRSVRESGGDGGDTFA